MEPRIHRFGRPQIIGAQWQRRALLSHRWHLTSRRGHRSLALRTWLEDRPDCGRRHQLFKWSAIPVTDDRLRRSSTIVSSERWHGWSHRFNDYFADILEDCVGSHLSAQLRAGMEEWTERRQGQTEAEGSRSDRHLWRLTHKSATEERQLWVGFETLAVLA